jgi:hypothetical protein
MIELHLRGRYDFSWDQSKSCGLACRRNRYVRVRLPLAGRAQVASSANTSSATRFIAWIRRACLSSAPSPGTSGPAYSRYLSSISASACSPNSVKNSSGSSSLP